MTRAENTGKRDLIFSGWVRKNLPDSSTGFRAYDIDFVLHDVRNYMFLEIKTNGAQPRGGQRSMYDTLSWWIKKGVDGLNFIEWHGWHTLIFENTCFHDGAAFFDGKEITDHEFIQIFDASNDVWELP